MEIVTDHNPGPGRDTINSAEEAREYLVRLRAILLYLGVADGKLEEGSLRCEPNISVRPKGSDVFGTRTEIKNLASFKAVFGGVEYEVKRQIKAIERGEKIVHETRRWDDANNKTAIMRTKEMEQEYRYFPEPDLVPMTFDPSRIEETRSALPELPQQKKQRFVADYGLSDYDAEVLTGSRAMADFFDRAAKEYEDAKTVANWVMGDFTRLLNSAGIEVEESKISPTALVDMLKLIDDGTISGKIAKTVFDEMFETGKPAKGIVQDKGLVQITDESAIETAIVKVLAENQDKVERYLDGKQELMGFFVGQVMRETRGKANPGVVNKVLREKLEAAKS
jgi:aspartyl-tRNA(Asn)/glutamyl-tRNA(Gln) amidotransferase subunit B